MSKRYAHCHFCDDIRIEVGNKTSLMGIYGGELLLEQIPAVLPKLCASTFVHSLTADPLRALAVRVVHDGRTLQEVELPAADLESMQAELIGRDTDDPVVEISIGVNLVFSPFVVDAEGSVVVTVIADGEEIPAGKLRLRKSPALAAARPDR